jgi:type II secretory pathway pseudopilin PulG
MTAMQKQNKHKIKGFSLIELMVAMTVTLTLLGLVSGILTMVLGTRSRENRKTDALVSARAALNVISREVSESGYGITNNGIVIADSDFRRLHFRANTVNSDLTTTSAGEDVTYFYDSATQSIVRYDPNDATKTSVIVNGISDVNFTYFNYTGSNSTPTETTTPTTDTGRVNITVSVTLEPVNGQANNQTVTFTSDVTLRNSKYMLNQY